MEKLTRERARELLETTTTAPHLLQHALAVSASMGAMAGHFGEDAAYWEAVGLLHDYDYQLHPDDHLQHTEQPLRDAGVDAESIRAILSHGWGLCTDIRPETHLERALYVVDSLSGLVCATAKMRPTGISDLTASSVTKKFKDKRFAAAIDRDVILTGLALLDMDRATACTLCIAGLRPHAQLLGIGGAS